MKTVVTNLLFVLALHCWAQAACPLGTSKNNELYAMGRNWKGSLGVGHDKEVRILQRVEMTNNENITVVAVSGSMFHTNIILSNGLLYAAGSGPSLGLGPGIKQSYFFERITQRLLQPTSPYPSPLPLTQSVCSGEEHSCVLLKDSTIHCSGLNTKYQQGVTDTTQVNFYYTTVVLQGSPISIACGRWHTVAGDGDHTWVWGTINENTFGYPTIVSSEKHISVSSGWNEIFLISPIGDVISQIFDSNITSITTSVSSLSALGDHQITVSGDTAIGWGSNSVHQISPEDSLTVAAYNIKVESASSHCVGYKHSLILNSCGTVFGFGSNSFHQLSPSSKLTFSKPTELTDVRSIFCTPFASFLVK